MLDLYTIGLIMVLRASPNCEQRVVVFTYTEELLDIFVHIGAWPLGDYLYITWVHMHMAFPSSITKVFDQVFSKFTFLTFNEQCLLA